MFCRTHLWKQVENTKNQVKKAKQNTHFRNAQRKEMEKAHLRAKLRQNTVDVLPPIAYHGGTRDSCLGFGWCGTQQ
jgi:hypothetical protein